MTQNTQPVQRQQLHKNHNCIGIVVRLFSSDRGTKLHRIKAFNYIRPILTLGLCVSGIVFCHCAYNGWIVWWVIHFPSLSFLPVHTALLVSRERKSVIDKPINFPDFLLLDWQLLRNPCLIAGGLNACLVNVAKLNVGLFGSIIPSWNWFFSLALFAFDVELLLILNVHGEYQTFQIFLKFFFC